MRKKLLKNGNSWALVIPPSYLELLGVQKEYIKNYDFELTVDTAQNYIIIKDPKKLD